MYGFCVDLPIGYECIGKIPKVGAPSVDVAIWVTFDPDNSDRSPRCGRRLDLHETHRTRSAMARLIDSRLLAGLSDNHQIIKVVLRDITAKKVGDGNEFVSFALFESILYNSLVGEVAFADRRAEAGDRAMFAKKFV
jgi:hypothetical protein